MVTPFFVMFWYQDRWKATLFNPLLGVKRNNGQKEDARQENPARRGGAPIQKDTNMEVPLSLLHLQGTKKSDRNVNLVVAEAEKKAALIWGKVKHLFAVTMTVVGSQCYVKLIAKG